MTEYIEREAAITAIYDIQGPIHSREARALRELPAADVVEVVSELLETVDQLNEQYKKAAQLSFVRDPLAYALYQVWRAAEKKGRRI